MSTATLDSLLDEVIDKALAKYADLMTPRDRRLIRVVMRRELSSHPQVRAMLKVIRAARARRGMS